MVMYCPYCDIEINEAQLEAEDGCCPECGAFISPSMVVTDSEDDSEDESETDSEDEEDMEIEVPEAAPGVDADANTGDSSNVKVFFGLMMFAVLGIVFASVRRKNA